MKKTINFYDTNELLHSLDLIEGEIYLSSITLQELEHIKTSRNKDEDVRFQARRVTRFLRENEDRYVCIPVERKHHKLLEKNKLDEDPDNLIISCAKLLEKEYDVTFFTDDICCYNIAKNIFGLKCKSLNLDKKVERYSGYKEIIMSDSEMAEFYENSYDNGKYELLTNEYLIIKNSLNQPVDSWKYTGNELVHIDTQKRISQEFGKVIPKDFYQNCLLDSFNTNQITLVTGKAGTGKSYLALAHMFSKLEKGGIDKIIIFVNPCKVKGSKELGYYKGTKLEKLMDEQIGGFLSSKLGDESEVLNLISKNKLVLLPISDIRGYDTSGMNAGIYITEAQNMSIDMMKLALQRIGEDCSVILDGDFDTQVDDKLFEVNNGMRRTSEVFRGFDLYGEIELKECYRSKIAEICDAM